VFLLRDRIQQSLDDLRVRLDRNFNCQDDLEESTENAIGVIALYCHIEVL